MGDDILTNFFIMDDCLFCNLCGVDDPSGLPVGLTLKASLWLNEYVNVAIQHYESVHNDNIII